MEEYKKLKVPKETVSGGMRDGLDNTMVTCIPYENDTINCDGIDECEECILGGHKADTLRQYLAEKEKKAIHCKTEDEWDRVHSKIIRSGYHDIGDGEKVTWLDDDNDTMFPCDKGIGSEKFIQYAPRHYWEKQSYTIISAEEYLGEEKEDYEQVNDKIIELLNTKQEDTMNTSIRKVFSDKTLEEAETIDKYFGGSIPQDRFGAIVLEVNKDAVFNEAQQLKADEEDKKEEK